MNEKLVVGRASSRALSDAERALEAARVKATVRLTEITLKAVRDERCRVLDEVERRLPSDSGLTERLLGYDRAIKDVRRILREMRGET